MTDFYLGVKTMKTEQIIQSKAGTAIIEIIPMYANPLVIREYRLQPKVQEVFQGEKRWSNIDFLDFFGKKDPERYKTFPEAQKAAKRLVNRVEEAWSN